MRRIRQKITIELNRSVVGHMGSYDCVCRVIVSFFVSLSFFSLLYWLWQARSSAPKKRIM